MSERIKISILMGAVFIAMMVFFANVHPIVLYDGDDWNNLSSMRKAFPIWHGFNPIKVLPETLMPICGYIAAYLITPIIGDYVYAVTLTAAFVVSAFITAYVYCFYVFSKKVFKMDVFSAGLISFLFFMLHFLIFKSQDENNVYMFFAPNMTCYFHYIIPALLNSALALYLYNNKNLLSFDKENLIKKSLLFLGIYLAIFSNIYHSIILISAIFFYLLEQKTKDMKLADLFLQNKAYVFFIGLWLVSLLFEANGKRARQIGKSLSELPVGDAAANLIHLFAQMNKELIIFAVLSVVISFVLFKRTKIKSGIDDMYSRAARFLIVSGLVTTIYIILLTSKTGGGYTGRIDAVYGVFFYILLFVAVSICYILKKCPKTLLIMPILVFILSVQTLFSERTFMESNVGNIAPYKCIAIDNYLISQMKEADISGCSEMVLTVPKGDDNDNWPHPMYFGKNIAATMYRHGLISQNLDIEIKADRTVNEEFQLDIK